MIRLFALSVLATLAAAPTVVHANSCNLYSSQRFGQIRVGCSITVFALPEIEPWIPEISRGGQVLTPTITQDEVTLKVMLQEYSSPDACYLDVTKYEYRSFDRYVLAWPDLQPGDEVQVDSQSYTTVVPGPGDCGPVEPQFYCQDGVRFCDDAWPHDDDDIDDESDDAVGCSAASRTPSWLLLLPFAMLMRRRQHQQL